MHRLVIAFANLDEIGREVSIGRTLLHRLTLFLEATGWSRIKLAVVRGNDQAVRFYKREGGRVVGEFVDGVLWHSENLVIEFP